MEKISFEDSGKFLRLGDCLETNTARTWISASGTLQKSVITAENAIENIKKHYKTILIDYPTLRLKLVTKDNLPYWYYATDEEIQFDNLIKKVDAPFIDEISTNYETDIAPLWRIHISQIDDKTKIRVMASHSIITARAIFDLLDLFTAKALNQEINEKSKNQPALYEYGKKDWFTEEITKTIVAPYDNIPLNETKLNPPLEMPSHVINPQWDVPYPPLSKFCKKHGFGIQAILMAIQNEAMRELYKGEYDDVPIGIQIPIDTRNSSYASELFKKSLFFTHAGVSLVNMKPEKDIIKNIKNCAAIFYDPKVTIQSCNSIYFIANMRNFETGKISTSANFPNPAFYTFASHIGLVSIGLEDLQLRIHFPVFKTMYWPNLYAYHNKETFYFMYDIPYNCPIDLLQTVKNTSLKYYDYIVNDIKN
ncbi:hypothetical protein BCR32DRAFT_294584 [Anaeromyces robustus]|uniref:Condensation domain-containing protein n=1 Tax=Anaeromyces robustus TaxID=1754192 RepID=A0A1Y1X0C0_9FUNG|nr:hypothetical protein BCR32DRAFT_294584 [Anaeromyces robustus]|eukprot:ORX79183.1 hypothetical protein BCR32DRAFT_294584 [Anaeromyces robustus]